MTNVPRKKRLWLRLAAGLLAALLLVIIFLPTALGSRWIYQPLVSQLAADDFHLQVDSVRLRWLSPLQLSGVTIRQEGGPALVTIAGVKTDRGLLSYLLGGRRMGRVVISDPVLDVQLLKDSSNLQRFAQAIDRATRQSATSKRQRPAIDIQVVVQRLSATVKRASEPEPLVIIPPLDLDVTYRAASEKSHVTIMPNLILDQVELTPELVELGLDRAIPLLANSAWFAGRVSLAIGQIDIPLDDPASAVGDLELTLHQVRSGPSNPAVLRLLDFVAALRRTTPQHELVFVDGSKVLVNLADSRVHHRGLRMGLPKVDSRLQLATSGSVGLKDRSLDLLFEVPVPLEQLALREQVQKLGVPALKLPIGGTLDEPQVGWGAVRGDAAQLLGVIREKVGSESPRTAAVLGALEGLTEGKADEAIAGAIDLIEQLRQRRKSAVEGVKTEPAAPPETRDAAEETPEKKSQPVRERLRDFFRRGEK